MQNAKQEVNFSRKCRDRVNQLFAQLRSQLEPFYPRSEDWNRFRIIERALARIRGTGTGCDFAALESAEPTHQKSNKEACAFYRSKLNFAFDMLKAEIEKRPEISSRHYRLFTRAGILQGTIDILQTLGGVPSLPKPAFAPRPAGLKRKHSPDALYDLEPLRKRQSSPSGSVESISPRSQSTLSPPFPTASELPAQFHLTRMLQTQALINFYASVAKLREQTGNAEQSASPTWRPWL